MTILFTALYIKRRLSERTLNMTKEITANEYPLSKIYDLPAPEKWAQEEKSLLNIRDSFKKIVITKGIK